jgi:DNA-binding GntR family transcriptional regulator
MRSETNIMVEPGRETQAGNTPERIRTLIERDIDQGVLAPGVLLDERAMATQFGVSRTPVREALLMLAARKLVTIVPRVGAFVYKPDSAELVALLEYLGELEGVAARLAAERMTAAQRARLSAIHEESAEMAKSGNRPGYEQANLALHELIYRGGGNTIVLEEIMDARRRLANFRRHVFDQPGRLLISHREHEKVVLTICNGDGEAAAQAMRDHIIGKGKAFADLILANLS